MITPAQRAEIRRLCYGEHWKIGTIAAQLGLHRETVRAAVEHESGGVRRGVCRPSALDPYLPFIRDTLARYPRLRATRIHEMVRQRGYPGSAIQVRRLVRRLRPETTRAVYRRVVTLVGEQAQVDWGTFGKVRIGHGTRAPPHPRTSGTLQAPRRLGLGLADRLRPPRPRTHPHPRLPRPRRERHPGRGPRPRFMMHTSLRPYISRVSCSGSAVTGPCVQSVPTSSARSSASAPITQGAPLHA